MHEPSSFSRAIANAKKGFCDAVSVQPSQAKRLLPLADASDETLILHEIYASVQGEGSHVGLPCTFVRTSACNLRCRYCDTRKAFGQGRATSLNEALHQVKALNPRLVLVTGGEPLLQAGIYPFMQLLLDEGYTVLLETSGSISTNKVDPRVTIILDIKTPASGECGANDYDNLHRLRPHDEVKFVLGDRDDYLWARRLLSEADLPSMCQVLMGPIWGSLDPKDLAAWIVADGLKVRMQVQVHKYIWGAHVEGV